MRLGRTAMAVAAVALGGCGPEKLTFEGFWCGGIVGAHCPAGSTCEMPHRIFPVDDDAGDCVVEDDNACDTAVDCAPGYECAESAGRFYCAPERICEALSGCRADELCKERLVLGGAYPLALGGGYCAPIAAEVDAMSCTRDGLGAGACDAPLTCTAGQCQLLCPAAGCPAGLTCQDDGAGSLLCLR